LRKNLRRRADGRWYWHWDPAFLSAGDEPSRAASQARCMSAAAHVTVPTLLLRGEQSDVVTRDGAEELRTLIPGARYDDVVGTGHMVAGDDNADFTRRVREFLDELPEVR
jgi:pimeloyl-ACP methyl ester carboxylesterase